MIAILVIQMITTGFNLLGINKLFTDICVGAVLIAVLAANSLKSSGKLNFSKREILLMVFTIIKGQRNKEVK